MVVTNTMKAEMFIEENKYRLTREEIIMHLSKTTNLTIPKLIMLCNKILPDYEIVIKPKEEIILYKGKTRSFFRFDTSNLWRDINGEKRK